jgi:hypothetical protein
MSSDTMEIVVMIRVIGEVLALLIDVLRRLTTAAEITDEQLDAAFTRLDAAIADWKAAGVKSPPTAMEKDHAADIGRPSSPAGQDPD